MRPEELRPLLPLYALGALPEGERRAVEAGLTEHPQLLPELRALQETAADLSAAAPPLRPPPELKAKLLERVRREGPGPRPAPDAAGTAAALPPEAPQTPPAPRRMALPRWLPQAAAAAVIALLAWGGVRAYPWLEWLQATRDPGAKLTTLVDEGGRPVGRCIFLADGRTLVYTRLPPPPPGKTYQLWGVNQRDHLGLDTYRGGLIAFRMPAGYRTVHITEERAGGSRTPTQIRATQLEN